MKPRSFIFRTALLGVVALALAACETTGDPNQGGLFGWSPSKADQRSAAYQARLSREKGRLQSEQSESASLQYQQRRLASRIDAANAELSQMLLDVQSIERAGGTQLAGKAASVRADIERVQQSSDPQERQVRAARREVESLREELRLLQQRQ